MYFRLEELRLEGDVYLTELTWSFALAGEQIESHYAVRHPGWAEADDLMLSLDQYYSPPQRYSGLVIGYTFLADYVRLPKGTPIYGPNVEQCLALLDHLRYTPNEDRSYEEFVLVARDHLTSDVVRGLAESLQAVRDRTVGVQG